MYKVYLKPKHFCLVLESLGNDKAAMLAGIQNIKRSFFRELVAHVYCGFPSIPGLQPLSVPPLYTVVPSSKPLPQ